MATYLVCAGLYWISRDETNNIIYFQKHQLGNKSLRLRTISHTTPHSSAAFPGKAYESVI